MKDLHLTHGGFYRHFATKEDLFVEAFEQALEDVATRVEQAICNAPPGGEAEALITAYLSPDHCNDIAGGCPVAALAPEIPRRPNKPRERMLQAIREYVRRLRPYVPGHDDDERRRNAVAVLSGMAGTLTIARAFSDADDRACILEAARTLYLRALVQQT
jgi:TetR/AcrR family transcriptional repressor of nem operon